jgi:hypothetical protein
VTVDRIVWTERTGEGTSGWNGTVGRVQLFTVTWSLSQGRAYELRTRLPFKLIASRACGALEDVKAYAERVLSRFVEAVGVQWPEVPGA